MASFDKQRKDHDVTETLEAFVAQRNLDAAAGFGDTLAMNEFRGVADQESAKTYPEKARAFGNYDTCLSKEHVRT